MLVPREENACGLVEEASCAPGELKDSHNCSRPWGIAFAWDGDGGPSFVAEASAEVEQVAGLCPLQRR